MNLKYSSLTALLKFTPLEFETDDARGLPRHISKLKFTPLEFETHAR